MERQPLSRRDFNRLSSAALGGLLAGGMLGCSGSNPPPGKSGDAGAGTATGEGDKGAGGSEDLTQYFLMEDIHVCRGLNTCKGKDKEHDNDCAGQGDCATFDNSCSASNACKGKGGCGATPGFNACGGQGGCHVPLMAHAWDKARKVFEDRMNAEGQKFGDAPAKKKAPPKADPVDDVPEEEMPDDEVGEAIDDADAQIPEESEK